MPQLGFFVVEMGVSLTFDPDSLPTRVFPISLHLLSAHDFKHEPPYQVRKYLLKKVSN
jgi:hypothetical protein